MRTYPLALLFLALSVTPALASAASPESGVESSSSEDPLISSGAEAEACAWPSVVAVVGGGGLCTGALVHPEIVLYAAHCGADGKMVRFGESMDTPYSIAPDYCMTNPAYYGPQGQDWAFCKLPHDVPANERVPITPPIWGNCEVGSITTGAQAAIVGFGENTDGDGAGTKRWAMTQLTSVNWANGTTTVGGNGDESICPGDSGGPAMLRYPDGTWHTFGIASTYSGTCGSQGVHSLVPNAVSWVEAESGVDITPCFDAAGEWAPTSECYNHYAADGPTGYGIWSNSGWCEGTPAEEWPSLCGDSFVDGDEDDPTITIDTPSDGEHFDGASALVDIAVSAADASSGVESVILYIEGEEVLVDPFAPYGVNGVNFPEGTYTISAVAIDYAGHKSDEAEATITVGDPPPGDGDGDGDGSGDGDGDGDAGSDGSDIGADSDEGCGCSSPTRAGEGAPALLLGVVGAGWIRRRRR